MPCEAGGGEWEAKAKSDLIEGRVGLGPASSRAVVIGRGGMGGGRKESALLKDGRKITVPGPNTLWHDLQKR